ncbi:MAG: hypothetical protein R2831_10175 [Chitinophagaceae bacterium]
MEAIEAERALRSSLQSNEIKNSPANNNNNGAAQLEILNKK